MAFTWHPFPTYWVNYDLGLSPHCPFLQALLFRILLASVHIGTCSQFQQLPFPNETLFTVYPKKYAHGFVVLCFVVVMQSFTMNSHEVFIHIHQGCFVGTGEIVRLPQCQWSKPDGYGKISQCTTTTKHSKAKTMCIFLGIYCTASGWEVYFLRNFLPVQSIISFSSATFPIKQTLRAAPPGWKCPPLTCTALAQCSGQVWNYALANKWHPTH